MTNKELIDKIRQEIEMLDGADYPCDNSEQEVGYHLALDEVGRFLDSLSVEEKPTNLEQELEAYHQGYWPKTNNGDESLSYTPDAVRRMVMHFYELGKQAKQDAPEGLDEAIKSYVTPRLDKEYVAYGEHRQKQLSKFDAYDLEAAIEFGAEWAFGQGHTFTQPVLTNGMGQTYVTFKFVYCESEVEEGEEVIVQIRKK